MKIQTKANKFIHSVSVSDNTQTVVLLIQSVDSINLINMAPAVNVYSVSAGTMKVVVFFCVLHKKFENVRLFCPQNN